MNRRVLAGLGLALVALGSAAYSIRRHRTPRAQTPIAVSSARTSTPSALARFAQAPPVRPPARPSLLLNWPFEEPKPEVVPLPGAPMEPVPLRLLPPEQRAAERARRHAEQASGAPQPYPPTCYPAMRAPARIAPRHGPVFVRPLTQAQMEPGRVLVRVSEDRDHLIPGDAARVTAEASADGQRTPFAIKEARLLKAPTKEHPDAESVAVLAFRDDGKDLDARANDGVATASVTAVPELKGFVGNLTVRVDIVTAKESGEIELPMAVTGPPPAEFTGKTREAVENGSLAIYVGVHVTTPGRYTFTARLYDAVKRAMAIVDANADLDASSREVRFEIWGKLLRDLNVEAPWEFRDVEGYFFSQVDGHADLVPMRISKIPYRTRFYPLGTFSDRPWGTQESAVPAPSASATP